MLMDNQPTQPMQPQSSNDFLNRMDMATNPNLNPDQPKKKSKGLIIGIIVGIVVLIGAAVAAVIILTSNKAEETKTATPTEITPTDEPDDDELPEDVVARNELRKDDLAPLKTATLDYKKTHNNAILGDEVRQWEWLVKNYIPEGLKDAATDESYTIKAVCKFSESCVDLDTLDWEENQHEIYIYLNAACKGETKDNLLVSYTGKNGAAMFTILEGSKTFLCTSVAN